MTVEELEKRVILKCLVGSRGFGVNLPDSDYDKMAVVIPTIEQELGLRGHFQTLVDKENNTTYYSLRHFAHLAANGNPTVLCMFWAPMVKYDSRGSQLREQAHFYASRRAGVAFAGYMKQQKMHMTGERGNGGHGAPRQALIDKYGYDTKFAMHLLRLGLQGIEFMTSGVMSLPMGKKEREFLIGVRDGVLTQEAVLETASEYEKQIRELAANGPLPAEPNWEQIERWVLRRHLHLWKGELGFQDRLDDEEMVLARRGV
jgi:uncharacterized protein